MLKIGIIGLANVGKSSLFKALTNKAVACANFPFCTIEPNKGIVGVPDNRLQTLANVAHTEKIIPAVSFGKPWIGVKDSRISTIIDIKRFAHLKLRALREHITQMADVSHFLQAEGTPLFDQEYFMLRMKGTQEVFMGKNDHVASDL